MMIKKYKFEPRSWIYLIPTYLCSWGFAYLLEEFVRLLSVFELEFFATRINVSDPLVWDITFEICFLVSFIVFHIVFCKINKTRRETFIEDTKGLITKKDGFIYNIKQYGINDIIIIGVQVVFYLILFLIKSSLCPLSIIYRFCGVPLGAIISAIFLAVLYVNHTLWAQYSWRVKYYMDY